MDLLPWVDVFVSSLCLLCLLATQIRNKLPRDGPAVQVNCEAVGYLLDAAVANGADLAQTSARASAWNPVHMRSGWAWLDVKYLLQEQFAAQSSEVFAVFVLGRRSLVSLFETWRLRELEGFAFTAEALEVQILINGLGSMAKAWNQEGERRLRGQSQVDYTIIRPGYMGKVDATLDDEVSLALADDGGDLKVSAIPHRCVAELCVRCLAYPNAARATLVAMTQPGDGPRTWEPLLEKVAPDRREFPGPELLGEHYAAVRTALASGLVLGVSAAALVARSLQ
ncbi:unnamed protein product [Symbiodinium sp. CCMP2592]|nr:unnamed protein product [Symbiodinium sp. CCMP2592]